MSEEFIIVTIEYRMNTKLLKRCKDEDNSQCLALPQGPTHNIVVVIKFLDMLKYNIKILYLCQLRDSDIISTSDTDSLRKSLNSFYTSIIEGAKNLQKNSD